MGWKAIDRRTPVIAEDAEPLLGPAVCEKIRSFFPRYETKRAALLPALHVVQDALGHVSSQAMKEVADLLEIPPSAVLDTLSFYTHFWDHPKGAKVIVQCRSLSCQMMGGEAVLAALKDELGVEEHGTSADGGYSLMTEECLAACDHAPCMLIGERLHKGVKPADVPRLLKDSKNDRIDHPRSSLFDGPAEEPVESVAEAAEAIGTTSDVREMKES